MENLKKAGLGISALLAAVAVSSCQSLPQSMHTAPALSGEVPAKVAGDEVMVQLQRWSVKDAHDFLVSAGAHRRSDVSATSVRTVGKLYLVVGAKLVGECSAAVVNSAQHNLIMTAQHCLPGGKNVRAAFAPGVGGRPDPDNSMAGDWPYGLYPVMAVGQDNHIHRVAPYSPDQADQANHDVAFARVGPNHKGALVEDVVGGNSLAERPVSADVEMTMVGYSDQNSAALRCTGVVKLESVANYPNKYPTLSCGQFPAGTSGGPWFTELDETTGRGTIGGLTGGPQTGGATPETSYSPILVDEIHQLYSSLSSED